LGTTSITSNKVWSKSYQVKIKKYKNHKNMNSSNYITMFQNQISQSMPECENINRDGEEVEN